MGVVRHLMGAVARLGQHSPEFVENAKLAGSEACTNAVMLTGQAGAHEGIRVSAFLEHPSMYGDRWGAIEMAPEEGVDIDWPDDLARAEALLNTK